MYTKKYKSVEEFKQKAEEIIQEFEELLDHMPKRGDSSSECQRTHLQQQINEVQYGVNGITEEDFITNEYSEEI